MDQQIADQVWLELPDVEFDTAAIARITGASQSRQYWRDAGYDFVDEPRVSGKGFPWGPPGPGSWRGPGKGPWPTAVQGTRDDEVGARRGCARNAIKNCWGNS